MKHQLSIAWKASNFSSSLFNTSPKHTYTNNVVKNKSETTKWEVFLITEERHNIASTKAYRNHKNLGCDVIILYRFIHISLIHSKMNLYLNNGCR
jgi:hypothetical protein